MAATEDAAPPAVGKGRKESSSWMERVSARFHGAIHDAFDRLGERIAARPRTVIAAGLALTALCSLGMLNFKVEGDQTRLYTPGTSVAWEYKDYVESTFGNDPTRILLFVTRVDGGTVLTPDALLALYDAVELVQATKATCTVGSCSGQEVTYDEVALKPNGVPFLSSVLSFFPETGRRAAIAQASAADIVNAVNDAGARNSAGQLVDPALVMGSVQRNTSGQIVAAKALQATMVLAVTAERIEGLADQDPRTSAVELAAARRVRAASPPAGLRVVPYTDAAEQDLQDTAINNDITLLVFGYTLTIVYAHMVFARPSWVRSRMNLAIWSILSVGMAIISTFGLCSALGIKFNLVVQSLSLLLLGLGLDDSFVITEAHANTSANLGRRRRVARTLARAGATITVTSISDFFAFVVGSTTSLPALRDFCAYAAIGILFDFLYQSTVFVAFLALDDERQEGGHVDMVPCMKREVASPLCGLACFRAAAEKNAVDETSSRVVGRFTSSVLPRVVLSPAGKAVTLLLSLAILVIGAIGAVNVEMDFQVRWFTPDGAWMHDVYAVQDAHFAGENIPFAFYTKQVDYPANMASLKRFGEGMDASPVVLDGSVRYWYASFVQWIASSGKSGVSAAHGGPADEADFYPWLREWLDTDSGRAFVPDIKFTDATRTAIKATKIPANYGDIPTAQNKIDAVDATRAVAASVPALDAFVYAVFDLFFDGFRVITEETLRNVGTALGAVILVCVVTLADWHAAALVFLMIVVVDIGLLGSMFYLDLTYNSVTAINMVLAIGIGVDYSAHVAHAFLVATGETRQERAREALEHIGSAVVNGAFSTFLAVLPLALSTSYIFQVFFRMWTLLIALALFQGVCVLPVVLSFVGPAPYANAKELQDECRTPKRASSGAGSKAAVVPSVKGPAEGAPHQREGQEEAADGSV